MDAESDEEDEDFDAGGAGEASDDDDDADSGGSDVEEVRRALLEYYDTPRDSLQASQKLTCRSACWRVLSLSSIPPATPRGHAGGPQSGMQVALVSCMLVSGMVAFVHGRGLHPKKKTTHARNHGLSRSAKPLSAWLCAGSVLQPTRRTLAHRWTARQRLI